MKTSCKIVSILFFALGLAGCRANETYLTPASSATVPAPVEYVSTPAAMGYPGGEPLPLDVYGYPAGIASPTPWPTLPVKITPTLYPGAITPIPAAATPTLPADACTHPYNDQGRVIFPPPNVDALEWVNAEVAGLPALRLTGLNVQANAVPSPYGDGLALHFLSTLIAGPGGVYMGWLVMASPGEQPWLAVTSAWSEYHDLQWLPEDRLIWVDQGELYTARADGSEKVHYPLPERAVEVWSNGRRAIVSGESGLWRVNLITREWREIRWVGGIGDFSQNAALARDLSGLLINSAGMLIEIPFDPPWTITRYERIAYGGRDGRIGKPFTVGRKYIFPGEVEIQESAGPRTVLFERGNSAPAPLTGLVPFKDSMFATDFSVSPDGGWAAFRIDSAQKADDFSYRQAGVYLARSDDLQNGRFILTGKARTAGWRADPPAYFYVSGGVAFQVALPTYEKLELARIDPDIYATSTHTILWKDGLVLLFDPQGRLESTVDLPYRSDQASLTPGSDGDLYISVTDSRKQGAQCLTAAWLDVIDLPAP